MIEVVINEFKNWHVAVANNKFFTFFCGFITIVGLIIWKCEIRYNCYTVDGRLTFRYMLIQLA